MFVCFFPFLFSIVACDPLLVASTNQLQEGDGFCFLVALFLFLWILSLCLLTCVFILGRHLYPTFTVCLLMIERSGCPGGNVHQSNSRIPFLCLWQCSHCKGVKPHYTPFIPFSNLLICLFVRFCSWFVF